IAGSVTTAVILANLANRNVKSFIVDYDKLLEIRNRILSDYSKNASIDNQCTIDEFVNKVNDGTLKIWINDNFKEYFKSVDSNTTFDFNLKIEQTDNEILLTLTPSENQTLRLDQFSNKYDASIVEFNKNSVVFKFPKSEFLKQQLFSYEQLSLFQSKLIADMQKNKLTFENLQAIVNPEQKTQIIDWVSNSLGIQNIFSEISFQKLQATNDTYSITLTPNNNYVLGWANNETDTTDFIIQRKSITINFNKIIKIENEHLIQLKDAINIYLQQKNIDYLTWIEHFDKKDQIYQEFLDFVYNKLDTLMNNTLTNGCIGSLEILDNANDVYSLKIIPSIGYSFLSDSIYYDNEIILLTDIEIYSYIEFTKNNIDEFVERIQQSIDLNKYSSEQFKNWIETDEFKEFIGANLKTSNNINIDINKIKNISYDAQNNILTISPQSNYKFKLLETISNITVNENGELLISSLNLFEYIHFTKLIELFNGVQYFIDQYKITAKEFREYIDDKNNLNNLKTLISQSLFISENEKINLDKLLSFRFENDNLLITLDTNYTIYSSDSYANVSLIADTLTIKNLVYFNTVDLVKLNNLFNVIQTLINDHKYTISEFNQYINDNFDSFKTLVANNLFVNENDTILETEITNIAFENGLLRVSLNNNYIKYNLEQNNNFELDNTDLLIKNLNYYNEINFDNLDNLFNAIQDQIK
ncbi:MAG: hypothetical protein K2K73_02065, partial [Ureaplasma sp.]|nr:hypothetical protein [Ureaplasma sp.]